MPLRIFLNGCLLVSVLFFPWWLTIAFALLLVVSVRAYEILFWGFLLDVLYAAKLPDFFGIPILFTLCFGFIFIAVELIKPGLVFYGR